MPYTEDSEKRRMQLAAALTAYANAPLGTQQSGPLVEGANMLNSTLQREKMYNEYQDLQKQYLNQKPTLADLRGVPLTNLGNGNYKRIVPGRIY